MTPAPTLAQCMAELWIAQRLGLPTLFDGTTDGETRKERIRRAITDLGVEHVAAGKRKGKTETWGEVFRRLYHEPLVQQTKSENVDDHRKAG